MKRNKTSALLLAVLILFTTFFNSMPVQAAGEEVEITLIADGNLKFLVAKEGMTEKDKVSTVKVKLEKGKTLKDLKANDVLKKENIELTKNFIINEYKVDDAKVTDDYKFEAAKTVNISTVQNKFTIKFNTNGGDAITDATVDKGKQVTKPTDPTKEGNKFLGWFSDEGLKTAYDFKTTVTKDMTLYAKWELNKYDVTFDSAGGSPTPEKQVVEHGKLASVPTEPKKDGHTFDGWFDVDDKNFDFTKPITANKNLVAKWTELNKHKITFDAGTNGTIDGAQTKVIDKYEGAPWSEVAAPTVEAKEGYTFTGWDKAIPSGNITTAETFTAQYNVKEYTVTFDSAGGSPTPVEQVIEFGKTVNKPEEPKKEGHTFVAWYNGNTKYDFNTPVKSSFALVARWEEVAKEYVTITFKAGVGGKLEGATSDSVEKGSKWSNVRKPTVTPNAGYKFIGWDPTFPSDNSIVNYSGTYTAKFEKIVLPVDKVTVKFTSGDNGYISGTKEHTLNKGTSSRGYIPTPIANSGYVFDRWSPSVPNYFNYSETYTAIFKKAPAERLTIKFVAGANGYLEGQKEFPVDKGYWSSDIKKPIPKPDAGYVFDYWGPSIPSRFNESRTYTAYFKRASSSTVTVKYLDRYGRRVAGTETYTGRVGEEYRTYAKDANGFKLRDNSLPGNRTGKFTDKNITVEYQYTENYIPSGKVRVTFLDSRNGELKNRKGELVDIVLETVDRNTKWKNIWLPPVTAESGYRHDRWSPALPSGETKIDSNKEFTAYFERTNANKIVVRFQAGSNGYIEGNTKYEVTKGSKWTDISVPRPVANSGYYFNKWNPDFPKTIEKDVTYTAEFLPVTESYDEKHKAYIEGYPDGTFRPEANVTRAEAATMFTRVLIEDARGYSNNFLDVKNNDWHNIYVSYLSAKGFIDGYPDGTFRPDVPMTRAEFAAIASRIKKLSGGVSTFKDVSPQHWAKEYIQALADGGIVKGYGNNEFRPDVYITREEAVTMINRLLERKMDRDFINRHNVQYTKYKDISRERWSFADIQEASISHDAKMNKYDGERWNKIIN